VISDLDKPYGPYQEAMLAWRMKERGVTQKMREEYRRGVLHCTAEDLKAVAKKYLLGVTPSRAAFTGNGAQDLAGLVTVDLLALAA
jgi:Zn-dependent M16 (insulinase) family peptidase